MATYKDETRHHRMSWALLKPLKSEHQRCLGGHFVVVLQLKGYQMDMFAFSALFISSLSLHYPVFGESV